MSQQVIKSKGIYHGLPTFPDSQEGLTAIVTGANGISGDYMLRVLCESPRRWKKIYALSRRPPIGRWPIQVQHIAMDFLQPPEKLAETLEASGVKADYVFFFSYIQPRPPEGGGIWSAVDELVKVNTTLLTNFLTSLTLTPAPLPQRILLQLGAKYYGLHLGPAATPQEESDPRVTLEPNFYYPQEDALMTFCQQNNIPWTTTRPSWIPGAVTENAMNLVLPIAIYGTVQRYLKQPLVFPSDLAAWETPQTISSSRMNAYLSEWAVLSHSAGNQSLNACDDCAFSWGKFWPKLAAFLNMGYVGPEVDDDTSVYKEVETPYSPPPRGFGPPGKIRMRFSLAEWAKQEEVQSAWREIAEEYGLREMRLRDVDRVFGFADAALGTSYSMFYSTAKTKKLGFFGFVDSSESMFEVMKEFEHLGMVPPLN